MAKKIRFPLEMENGIEVRSLEELQDNFSLQKVLFYISDGKMQTWLCDRYLNEIADSIEQLDDSDPEYYKKIYDIFDVQYDDCLLEDIERAKEQRRKLELLKQFTNERRFLDNACFTAFEQDDVYDLLDEGVKTIYLCGDKFSIPLSVGGMTYIGVNNPVAVINSKTIVNWDKKNISISGVRFDDKYQALVTPVGKYEEEPFVGIYDAGMECGQSERSGIYGDYVESEFGFMLSPQTKAESRETYKKLSAQLEGVHYDTDRDIKNLKEKLVKSGVAGIAKSFLERL